MKNSSKIYVIYTAAVLAIGSLYMFFQHDNRTSKPEKGNVSIITAESTTSVKKTTSTAVTKYKSKTTTSRTSKTTTIKTTTEKNVTETQPTEAEELWLDINEADETELVKLPKIGEGLAWQIVSYRNNVGRFRNIEEIMNISGIGQGTFEAIRDFIYVTDPVYDEEQETAEEPEPEQQDTEHIPTLEEIAPLDLNTANKEELMLLPHVDEDIAQRIISFREQIKFSHPYELMYIEGLTQSMTADIIEYVTVENNEE